jgi:hypothetical protein
MHLFKFFLLFLAIVPLLAGSFVVPAHAADTEIIAKAKDILVLWQSRQQTPSPPVDCDRCFQLYERIRILESKGRPIATEMQALLKNNGKDLSSTQLKQLEAATDHLDDLITERKSLTYQYDSILAQYRRLKDRPDDKKAREDLKYENPMRVR